MTVTAKTVATLLLQTSDIHANMQAKHTSKLSIILTATSTLATFWDWPMILTGVQMY